MRKRYVLKTLTQVSFLAATLGCMRMGKSPLILAAMLLLSILSIVYGRLFCGYLCPVATVERVVVAVRKKLGIRELQEVPEMGPWITYPAAAALLALIIIQALTPVLKIKIAFPVLFIGFIVVILAPGRLWHRYLCPFALLMKIKSIARPGLPIIDLDTCKACSRCVKACPADALKTGADKKPQLKKERCILCYRCESACPFGSIR